MCYYIVSTLCSSLAPPVLYLSITSRKIDTRSQLPWYGSKPKHELLENEKQIKMNHVCVLFLITRREVRVSSEASRVKKKRLVEFLKERARIDKIASHSRSTTKNTDSIISS